MSPRLFARARDISPPVVELVVGAYIEVVGIVIIRRIVDDIKKRIVRGHERKMMLSRIFGFCRNADFVIGADEIWSAYDESAMVDALTNLSRIFSGRPEVMMARESKEPDYMMNIVSIGGPLPNPFTRTVMGVEEPSKRSDLPFYFNLQPSPECEGKGYPELKEMSPEPNWSIKDHKGKEVYIPEYYDVEGKGRVWKKDYGMIIKIKSKIEGAPPGRKSLILAGCHGYGTIASAMALGDGEILKHIWETADDKDFQAIVMCEISVDEPEYSELLEVVKL